MNTLYIVIRQLNDDITACRNTKYNYMIWYYNKCTWIGENRSFSPSPDGRGKDLVCQTNIIYM